MKDFFRKERRYRLLKSMGLCTKCGKRKAILGLVSCEQCRKPLKKDKK